MEIILYGFGLFAGIYLLLRSSYFVIRSLSAMARYLGISEFILSFLLLSLATSLSELTVGVNAAVSGVPELSLGDVLGTNLVNITLVLGIIAVIGKGIKLRDHKQFAHTRLTTLVLVSMPFLLLIDGQLSRLDGILLIGLFLLHILRIIKDKDTFTDKKTFRHTMEAHVRHTASSRRQFISRAATFAISSAVLILAAYTIVFTVTQVSQMIGISEYIIGLFVVAIGTSLPELTVGLRAVRSGKTAISIGNLFGAVSINATLVLGTVSIIEPINIHDIQQYFIIFSLTIGAMLLVFYFLRNKQLLYAREGVVLLFIYSMFLLLEYIYT